MSSGENLPIYVATDELLFELRELGYEASIELDDLIDFLDEDPSYIEQMRPAIMMTDEISFLSPGLAKLLHKRTIDARPT
jgi:hypothetical protein